MTGFRTWLAAFAETPLYFSRSSFSPPSNVRSWYSNSSNFHSSLLSRDFLVKEAIPQENCSNVIDKNQFLWNLCGFVACFYFTSDNQLLLTPSVFSLKANCITCWLFPLFAALNLFPTLVFTQLNLELQCYGRISWIAINFAYFPTYVK